MIPFPSSSYFLIDLGVTLTLFGYFASSTYDVRKVYELLNPAIYSFLSSPLDFLLIAVFRILFFIATCQLRVNEKTDIIPWLAHPFALFSLASFSFSFLKLIVYSEQPELKACCGIWLLPVWNIISSAYFYWSNEFKIFIDKKKKKKKKQETVADVPLTDMEQAKILLRYSYSFWPWLVVSIVLSSATSTVYVMIPHYQSAAMNGITKIVYSVDVYDSLKMLTALTIASMILSGLRGGCRTYFEFFSSSKMRKVIFNSIINQEIAFFDNHSSTSLWHAVECEAAISNSITTIFTLTGKCLVMAHLSWRLFLINFVALPVIMYAVKKCGDFHQRTKREKYQFESSSDDFSEELIFTTRNARSASFEKRAAEKFAADVNKRTSRTEALAGIAKAFLHDLYYHSVYVAVLFYGARLVSTGSMAASDLVTFLLYQLHFAGDIEYLFMEIPSLMKTLRKTRKFCELLVRQPRKSLDGTIEQPVKGELKLDRVSFSYPSRPGHQVINDLSLHIRAGETLALVGPSGGGKSTIVALIERFYEPDEGSITLDGVPIGEYNHEYYHRKVALVAQEPDLYNTSVRENIAFGCDATEDEIIEAAKTANAHDFIMALDKGYDTKCGEKGIQLSGGQKQRIAMARALVHNPSILILDEAISALDNYNECIVQEAMQRCGLNRTVIVIAHRLSTIEKADRIAIIDKGKLVQLGSHSELLDDKEGLYYKLVKAKDNSPVIETSRPPMTAEEILELINRP